MPTERGYFPLTYLPCMVTERDCSALPCTSTKRGYFPLTSLPCMATERGCSTLATLPCKPTERGCYTPATLPCMATERGCYTLATLPCTLSKRSCSTLATLPCTLSKRSCSTLATLPCKPTECGKIFVMTVRNTSSLMIGNAPDQSGSSQSLSSVQLPTPKLELPTYTNLTVSYSGCANVNITDVPPDGRNYTFSSYYLHSPPVATVFILAYILIFFLCMVGNLLVCFIVLKNKQMRTVTNIFILNLAISDLLVGIFCLPITLADNLITVPADGAVGVEVEGHQAFWTCDDTPFISVLTTVPPHTDSLGVSTKTKAGLVTEDDPLPF
ncbi:hypothetical protein NFI96_001636 [Prochilodus magdalenae]|nr:hypothetical protein NFI96_001636 [Prochilodus magdalenae]